MKSIISFDLDMTLLDHATMTIPDSALKAIDRLREDYYIVLGTARDMDAPNSSVYRDIICPDAIIHNDGTKITVGDELIYETFMPKELIRRVLEFGEREGLAVGWLTGTEDYFTHPENVTEIDLLRWGESRRNFIDPWEALDYPVRTMLYVGREEGAVKIAGAFPELDCPLIASRLGADLMEREKSKAAGLKRLCDYLGVDIRGCYAFGDSMNDYAILKEVGCGVAMGNAPDELKAVADYVTADIADDGVYKACVALGLIGDAYDQE